VIRSGSVQASSIVVPDRRALYSGRERPACRMYQTGTCGTCWPRQALMNAESAVGAITPPIVSYAL
jgi:hypothetical protein